MTTQKDVTLDLLAALEMYDGTCGSEETTIDKIGEGRNDSIILILSNGDEYELRVRGLRRGEVAVADAFTPPDPFSRKV